MGRQICPLSGRLSLASCGAVSAVPAVSCWAKTICCRKRRESRVTSLHSTLLGPNTRSGQSLGYEWARKITLDRHSCSLNNTRARSARVPTSTSMGNLDGLRLTSPADSFGNAAQRKQFRRPTNACQCTPFFVAVFLARFVYGLPIATSQRDDSLTTEAKNYRIECSHFTPSSRESMSGR